MRCRVARRTSWTTRGNATTLHVGNHASCVRHLEMLAEKADLYGYRFWFDPVNNVLIAETGGEIRTYTIDWGKKDAISHS